MERREDAKTNPYGANQYQMDPRQKLCWDNYINPKSETFSNAYRSALKAGYEESTAINITVDPWFVEKSRTLNMLDKAEKVLNEMLEMEDIGVKKVGDQEVVVREPQLTKIKQDTAKFVAERVGKAMYSTRNEITGENGQPIQVQQITGMQIINDGTPIQNKESETAVSS